MQLVGRRHALGRGHPLFEQRGDLAGFVVLALEIGDVLRDLHHQVVGVGLGGLVALDGLGVAAEVLAAQRDVEAHLHLAAAVGVGDRHRDGGVVEALAVAEVDGREEAAAGHAHFGLAGGGALEGGAQARVAFVDALDQGVDVGVAVGGADRRGVELLRRLAGEQAVAVLGGAELGPQLAEDRAVLDQAHAHQVELGRRDAAGLDPPRHVGFDPLLAFEGGGQAAHGVAQAHDVGVVLGDLVADLFEHVVEVGVGGVAVEAAGLQAGGVGAAVEDVPAQAGVAAPDVAVERPPLGFVAGVGVAVAQPDAGQEVGAGLGDLGVGGAQQGLGRAHAGLLQQHLVDDGGQGFGVGLGDAAEAEQQGGEPGGAEQGSHQRSRRDLSRVLTMGLSMYSIIVRLPVWMLASAAMPGEMPRCSEASPR